MKRSVGLTLVGVFVILLSGLTILVECLAMIAMLMAPQNAIPPSAMPGQPNPQVIVVAGMGFWLLVSAFGVVNGIGLLKRWMWCRYTTIVFSFIAATMSAFGAVLMAFIPFPPTPGVDAQIIGPIRIVLVVFYAFVMALFLALSLFLLRKKIAEEFRTAVQTTSVQLETLSQPPVSDNEPRPILVWIVAGLQMFGVIALPMVLFVKAPTFFLGMVFTDLPGKIVFSLWCLASFAAGIAIFRRIHVALWISLGIYSLGVLNSLIILLPGPSSRFFQIMAQYFPQPAGMEGFMRIGLMAGILFSVVPLILLLIGRRRYFEWCDSKASIGRPNA